MEKIKVFELRPFHNSKELAFIGTPDGVAYSGQLRVIAPHPGEWEPTHHARGCACAYQFVTEDDRPVAVIFG